MTLKTMVLAASLVSGIGLSAPAALADGRFTVLFGDGGAFLSLEKTHGSKHYDERRYDDHAHHAKKHHHGKKRHYGKQRHYDVLGPRQVRRILRSNGFRRISRPEFRPRREVYVAFAENRRGRDVRVVVDALYGDILRVRPLKRY